MRPPTAITSSDADSDIHSDRSACTPMTSRTARKLKREAIEINSPAESPPKRSKSAGMAQQQSRKTVKLTDAQSSQLNAKQKKTVKRSNKKIPAKK